MQSSGVPHTAMMFDPSSATARRAFSGVANFSKAILDALLRDVQVNSQHHIARPACRKITPVRPGQAAHQVERNSQITRLHQAVANLAGEACAVRRRRGSSIDRWMRLLHRRRAEFEILDLPELTVETLDISRFEYLNEHTDAFFKS